jgi:hypothetical protein
MGLGNISLAIDVATLALDYANRSGLEFQMAARRADLAATLHQAGEISQAIGLFAEAERIQSTREPARPILYSFWGYQYCDLLLDQGRTKEVIERARLAIDWEGQRNLDRGLDSLILGRAFADIPTAAAGYFEEAVIFLRSAGQLQYLILGLLARGTRPDLQEAFRIAGRFGMRLHLVDYHLAVARAALNAQDRATAAEHLDEADMLVLQTPYLRRRDELNALRALLNYTS